MASAVARSMPAPAGHSPFDDGQANPPMPHGTLTRFPFLERGTQPVTRINVTQITMHYQSRRMRRLIAAGLLPDRAGQPVTAWVHVSLAELRALDAGSVLQGEWVTAVRARWAAARAAGSVSGSDGAAWLQGAAARAVACDAAVIPVVTGQVDPAVLDDLVSLCLQWAGHGRCGGPGQGADPAGPQGQAGDPAPGRPGSSGPPPTGQATEMLGHAIIGKAIDLVSGPGGLASFLRTRLLDGPLAGPSLPLDVGRSAGIPAAIRRAVTLRDQHCQWAGGYFL
jgi:hypothetical protein